MSVEEIRRALRSRRNPDKAAILQKFFKTGPGEYAEGDVFLGIVVPELRKLVRQFAEIPPKDAEALLQSGLHEERLLALLILVRRYARAEPAEQAEIYRLYLRNTGRINNWDLVDLSAPQIVGAHLAARDRAPLHRLAASTVLWERRIAILATFHFIRQNEFIDALAIARKLLKDREDLIHKAVGWMLREVGKRDVKAEETFLLEFYRQMPRTMLRYAIERFPEPRRLQFLRGLA